MTIFKYPEFYPDENTPFVEHYHQFDHVFIGLTPFFKLNDQAPCSLLSISSSARQGYQQVTYEQALKEMPILEEIQGHLRSIYECNDDYPTDPDILQYGEKVSWQEIIQQTSLSDYRDLHKGLMTQLGLVRSELSCPYSAQMLDKYVQNNNLWYPIEGTFNCFIKKAIYELLSEKNTLTLYIDEEFYFQRKKVFLKDYSLNSFVEKVSYKDYYIHDFGHSYLFAIDWDSCFFVIAIKESEFSKKDIEKHFEGFWAGPKDNHLWTWTADEIAALENHDSK